MNKFTRVSLGLGIFMGLSHFGFSQNVGINTTGATPNASALLDMNTGNVFTSPNGKGLLIPNVALTGVNDAVTISLPATSLLVYVPVGSGLAPAGYYYNSGTPGAPVWTQLGAAPNNSWLLLGNTGTNPAINFVGTTDPNALNFRTNNVQRMTILSGGNVGINTAAPGAQLEVNSGAGTHAFYGHTPNTGAYVAYETPFTFGVPLQTINGAGVWSANPLANYTSMFAQSTGAANIAADINYSSVWIASYDYVQNASNTFSPMAVYGQLNNTGGTLAAWENAIEGYNNYGTTAGNSGISAGVYAVANSQNQDAFGVVGLAFSDQLTYTAAGGYFSYNTYGGVNKAYAYVAAYNGPYYKIIGTGAVSEVIPTPAHGRVTLECPESPEYWYQDYGTAKLVNGKAHVDLDPILADIIFVNDSNPIRVFCTPVGMPNFNGVTIMNESSSGFDIVELNGGNHSGRIDYQIVAKPKTNYGQGRFCQAPGPAGSEHMNIPAAKAKNAPDPSKIWHWAPDEQVYNYRLPKPQPVSSDKNQGTTNK